MIKHLVTSLFACCIAVSFPALAESTLYYAGFSFTGDYEDRNTLYPYAVELNAQDNLLEAALRDEMKKNFSNPKIQLEYGLGNIKSGSALSLAFGLSSESIEEVNWQGKFLYIYRIMTQVLVFDYRDRRLIASYPVLIQHQDLSLIARDKTQHLDVFKEIYLGSDVVNSSTFNAWVKKLNNLQVKSSYGAYLRINQIVFDDALLAQKPDSISEKSYATQVAQTFESLLSEAHSLPIIPFASGEAVGAKMAARFSNGDIFQLDLPDPDYAIDIRIPEFKSKKEVTKTSDKYAIGAFVYLKIHQPDLAKIYFEDRLKLVNFLSFAQRDMMELDYWSTFQSTQRALFSTIVNQISEKDKEVIGQLSNSRKPFNSFKELERIIEKCK